MVWEVAKLDTRGSECGTSPVEPPQLGSIPEEQYVSEAVEPEPTAEQGYRDAETITGGFVY